MNWNVFQVKFLSFVLGTLISNCIYLCFEIKGSENFLVRSFRGSEFPAPSVHLSVEQGTYAVGSTPTAHFQSAAFHSGKGCLNLLCN